MNNDNPKRIKRIKDFFEKNEYYIFLVIMFVVLVAFFISFLLVRNGPVNIGF